MPRLVGRRRNVGALVVPMFVIVVAAGGALQYYRIVDFPSLFQQVKLRLDRDASPNSSSALLSSPGRL